MKCRGIFGMAISLMLSGCVATYSEHTYMPSNLRIEIDSDNTLSCGYTAVSDLEHIYYFGQEGTKSGIYSMDRDGTNVKLIAEEKDVSEMQLVDNILYYLSFDSVYYGDTSKGDGIGSKVYTLKAIDLKSKEVHSLDEYQLLFQNYLKEYRCDFERGLVGFYYCGNDQFLLSTVDLTGPTKRLELISGIVTKDKLLFVDEAFNEYNILNEDMPVTSCNIYSNDSLFMITDWKQMDYMRGLIRSNNLYLYEGELGSSYDSAGIEFYKNPCSRVSINTVVDNQIVYTIDNYVVLYDLQNNTIVKKLEIPDIEWMSLVNNKFILAYHKDKNVQTLYRFMEEAFTYEKISAFTNERIVSISNDFIISMTSDRVKKYAVHDKDMEEIWSKELQGDYLKSDHSIELCDGRLFIKQFDINKERACLVEKMKID